MSTHIPVLLNEVIEGLAIQPGGRYIDCTLGGAGHALAILEQSSPGGQLLGIDADPTAIESARKVLASYGNSVLLVKANFKDLEEIARNYNFYPVHGIFFDLGLSSLQLEEAGRGFSFLRDAPLDMRFDNTTGETAADLVNSLPENELAKIIFEFGEEPKSRVIARKIVENRPVNTTLQLASIITEAIGGKQGRIHPATKTFQALRIAVNHELDNLKSALHQAINLLGYDGRLVVISYHSLEDRIVKQFMNEESRDCICPPKQSICTCNHHARLKLINKKVIVPQREEILQNPRSRSARLRIAERIIGKNEKYLNIGKHCFLIKVKNNGWRNPSSKQNLQKEVLKM